MRMNFTSYPKQLIIVLSLFFLTSLQIIAQQPGPCYTPIGGFGTTAYQVASGGWCLNCNSFPDISRVTDADKNNFATATAPLGLQASQGITVVDSIRTYPAGYHAGFVVETGNDLLTGSILQLFTLQTYNNGVLQESKDKANGISVSFLSGSSGKMFLNFKTTAAFDEVRFIFSDAINALTNFKVYYAMAFDANCGIPDNNTNCYDQLAGPRQHIGYNGGLLSIASELSNAANITDGNKDSYATLSGITNLSLLSEPVYVGVKDLEVVYPGGRTAGFIIGVAPDLFTAELMNYFSIQTYLHGTLQETRTFNEGNGLLKVSGQIGTPGDRKELSFTTSADKPFNEIRLVINPSGASVSLGNIRIYYAFESGSGCGSCRNVLTVGQPGVYEGQLVSRDRNPTLLGVYNTTGIYGVTVATLANPANVANNNTDDFASFNAVLGLLNSGVRITVQNNGTDFPANTFAGFAISTGAGLLNAAILPAITVRLYNNDGQNPVQVISGASLLNMGLLSGNSGPVFIGGKATVPFDEVELDINQGLLSVGLPTAYRIYYAFVIRDDDNDGVADCIEQCGSANDALDADGDGTPDACDACNLLNAKSGIIDSDNDGVPDACDADSDNDGIPDIYEDTNNDGDPANDDADGDDIPNYLDLDSDNDGIYDIHESGMSMSVVAALDTDFDGVIDAGVSKGNNGLANNIETTDEADASANYTLAETDGDDVADYLDLDSDNDGINDLEESGRSGITDSDGIADGADDDRDGIVNTADGNGAYGGTTRVPVDSDGDGVADFRDLDSDNDSINDIYESSQPGAVDNDGNGMVDGADIDGDGIADSVDGNNNQYGDQANAPSADTDGDGVPDQVDLDSDNDGGSDFLEGGQAGGTDSDNDGSLDGIDTDGDGIVDDVDGNNNAFGDAGNTPAPDTDNDNAQDYRDIDSNNDGLNDIIENGLGTLDKDGDGRVDDVTDPDGDGIANNGGLDHKPSVFGGLGKLTMLRMKVLLQGAMIGTTDTLMRDDLRQQGFVPLMQPYGSSMGPRFIHYRNGGYQQTTPAVLAITGNNAVVDWIFIEIRSSTAPDSIVYTVSALVQKDGDIVAADGNGIGLSLEAGNFYVAVKHRNHLGAMTAAPVLISGRDTLIDFTSMNNADLYHTSSDYDGVETAEVNGKKALWAGNCNANNAVKYDGPGNDRTWIATDVLNYSGNANQSINYSLAFGYFMGDINMNGNVKYEGVNNDRAVLANIALNYLLNKSKALNYSLLIEQLP